MADINFGGGETGDTSEFVSVTGTLGASASYARTGAYGWGSSAGTGIGRAHDFGGDGTRNCSCSVWVKVSRAAGTAVEAVGPSYVTSAGSTTRVNFRAHGSSHSTLADQISTYNQAGSPVGSTFTIPSTATWVRMTLTIDTSNQAKTYIDDTLLHTFSLSGTASKLDIASSNAFGFFDDFRIDDTTLSAPISTDWAIVRSALESGTPTYDAFTKNGGTLPGIWNDVPFGTGTNASSAGSTAAQTAHVGGFATLIGSGTLLAVKQGLIGKRGGGGGVTVSHRRRVSAADTDTALTLTTGDAYHQNVWSSLPSIANLDASEVGVVRGSGTSQTTTIEDVWVFALYEPAAGGPVSGDIVAMLGAVTAAATATETFHATITATLAAATGAAAATEAFRANVTGTLAPATATAAATETFHADVAGALAAPTAAAQASTPHVGNIDATLGAATAAATGRETFRATIAATLGAVEATAAASETFRADVAAGLAAPTGAAVASEKFHADVAATLGAATAAVAASETFHADIAGSLAAVTAAAQATTGISSFTATITATLAAPTAAVQATERFTGDIIAALPAVTATAASREVYRADTAAVLGAATGAATASEAFHADAAVSLATVTAAAQATERFVGLIDATLPAVTAAVEATATAEVVAPPRQIGGGRTLSGKKARKRKTPTLPKVARVEPPARVREQIILPPLPVLPIRPPPLPELPPELPPPALPQVFRATIAVTLAAPVVTSAGRVRHSASIAGALAPANAKVDASCYTQREQITRLKAQVAELRAELLAERKAATVAPTQLRQFLGGAGRKAGAVALQPQRANTSSQLRHFLRLVG